MLLQWHEQTINRIKGYFDGCVEETVRQSTIYIEATECKREVEKTVENLKKEVFKSTKILARNKGVKDESEGKKMFNTMFNEYLEEVERSMPRPRSINIEYDARCSLRARFSDMPEILLLRVTQIGRESKFVVDLSKHFTAHRTFFQKDIKKFRENTHDAELHVERTCDALVQLVMAYIDAQRGNDYSKDWFETIIDIVLNEVDRINITVDNKRLELHKEFWFDALLHIFGLSVTRFKEMHEELKRINNPANILGEKRDDLYQYFTTAYDSVVAMVSIANRTAEKIMDAYQKVIIKKIISDIAESTNSVPALKGNKSNLEAHVLKDMIDRECFEDLILYIRNPRGYYNRPLDDYCGTGESSPMYKIIKDAVGHCHEEIINFMKESTKEAKNTGGNVNAWLDALHRRISDKVPFTANDPKEAVLEEIQSKLECFQNEMLTALG